MGKLGKASDNVIVALIKALGDKDSYRSAADALGKLLNKKNVQASIIKSCTNGNINSLNSITKVCLLLNIPVTLQFVGSSQHQRLIKKAFIAESKKLKLPQDAYHAKDYEGYIFTNTPFPIISEHETILHKLAKEGKVKELTDLLESKEQKIDINTQLITGYTPLMCAIKAKQVTTAKLLINHGALIDVSDFEDIDLMHVINIMLQNETFYMKGKGLELFNFILQARDMFPAVRLKAAISYCVARYSNEKFKLKDNELLFTTTVGRLVNKEPSAFAKYINQQRNSNKFLAALRNITRITQERRVTAQLSKGNDPREYLMLRTRIMFELICICKGNKKALKKNKQYVTDLEREVLISLTAIWNNQVEESLNCCFFYPAAYKQLITSYAKSIRKSLSLLEDKQEYTYMGGYLGHCIYISFKLIKKILLVRIDNLWIENCPEKKLHGISYRDGKIKTTNEQEVQIEVDGKIKQVKPCVLGCIEMSKVSSHTGLLQYLKNIIKANDSTRNAGIKLIYKTTNLGFSKPNNEIKEIINRWSSHDSQTNDIMNCVIRSHNVGLRIRLGEKLYKTYRSEESVAKILTYNGDSFDEKKHEITSSSKNRFRGGKSDNQQNSNNIVLEEKLPTEQQTKLDHQLLDAAKSGATIKLQMSLQKGANIKTHDTRNNAYFATALHWSARNNKVHNIKALLTYAKENKAEIINHQIPQKCLAAAGSTALHFACYYGNLEAVKALVTAGIKLYIQDNKGNTALHDAVANRHKQIVKYLIQHIVKYLTQRQIVKYLTQQGASISIKNKQEKTASYKQQTYTNTTPVRMTNSNNKKSTKNKKTKDDDCIIL